MGGAGLFFAMASLGLPGLGDFVGEVLVLIGAFHRSVPAAVFATIGVLAATLYGLRIVQRTFHGPNLRNWKFADLSVREMTVVGALSLALLWLGLYPRPVLWTFDKALGNLQGVHQISSLPAAQPGLGGR